MDEWKEKKTNDTHNERQKVYEELYKERGGEERGGN